MNLSPLPTESDHLPLFQDKQSSLKRMSSVSLLIDELPDETLVTRAPSDGQSPPDIILDLVDFLHQFTASHAFDIARLHSIHGREAEESHRFVNVMLLD